MKGDQSTLHFIAQRLSAASGIEAGALDSGQMQWVVEARCRDLRLTNAATYAEYLQASAEEMDALIDALLIQETRFFRDPAVFEHIRAWAPQMAATFPGPLRILSAPCSTGQEAYSLAAVLHDAGLPLAGFFIDALDISHNALATARRAVYAESALKNIPAPLRTACGAVHDHHLRIHDALRHRIRFEHCNLAEPGALEGGAYQLILCRNLFIYLQPRARAVLAQSLFDALVPGGRLVLGTADHGPELDALFTPSDSAASFAFTQKRRDAAATAAVEPERTFSPVRHPKLPFPLLKPPVKLAASGVTGAAELYRRAVEHHKFGNLRQSERRCRQALYLAPAYLPALELLQTIWQRHPNARLRHALQARIQRTRKMAEAGPSSSPQENRQQKEPL